MQDTKLLLYQLDMQPKPVLQLENIKVLIEIHVVFLRRRPKGDISVFTKNQGVAENRYDNCYYCSIEFKIVP